MPPAVANYCISRAVPPPTTATALDGPSVNAGGQCESIGARPAHRTSACGTLDHRRRRCVPNREPVSDDARCVTPPLLGVPSTELAAVELRALADPPERRASWVYDALVPAALQDISAASRVVMPAKLTLRN